jgi:hypothetical protein
VKFAFAIGFWIVILVLLVAFIRVAGNQKPVERRQYRDRQPPTNHDFTATHELLTIFQIVCAAVGVIALVLLFLFGDQFLNLIFGA